MSAPVRKIGLLTLRLLESIRRTRNRVTPESSPPLPRYRLSACCSIGGERFAPFSRRGADALRRLWRSKSNRCGRTPVSKVSDNEHTAAALGHSEVLSVKHSVRETIPEVFQRPEDGTKVPSSIR
jgi:hypothetical protein